MDKIFGLAEKALSVSEQRATLITSNLVNSGTPNYKAKDINFDAVMKGVQVNGTLTASNPKHIMTSSTDFSGLPVQYRIPMQVSMDGNTVDPEIERKNFMQNSLKYQVSMTFIQNKTDQLMKALKGE